MNRFFRIFRSDYHAPGRETDVISGIFYARIDINAGASG